MGGRGEGQWEVAVVVVERIEGAGGVKAERPEHAGVIPAEACPLPAGNCQLF